VPIGDPLAVAYVALKGIHLLSVSGVVGASLLAAFTGADKAILDRFGWSAFAVAILSGGALAALSWAALSENPFFWSKMALVLAGLGAAFLAPAVLKVILNAATILAAVTMSYFFV
jgi:hypothetical protein